MLHDEQIKNDEFVIHIPNPFNDVSPPTLAGGGPPKIPTSGTIVVGDYSRGEKISMVQRVSLLGCLLQLVVLLLVLWAMTSCVAVVALVR